MSPEVYRRRCGIFCAVWIRLSLSFLSRALLILFPIHSSLPGLPIPYIRSLSPTTVQRAPPNPSPSSLPSSHPHRPRAHPRPSRPLSLSSFHAQRSLHTHPTPSIRPSHARPPRAAPSPPSTGEDAFTRVEPCTRAFTPGRGPRGCALSVCARGRILGMCARGGGSLRAEISIQGGGRAAAVDDAAMGGVEGYIRGVRGEER